jgi:hypothetical protein
MTYSIALIVVLSLIVILAAALWGPVYARREKPTPKLPHQGAGRRERYGPPPGMWRALSHEELPDDRGWPGFPKEYEASSASAISHMIERSA